MGGGCKIVFTFPSSRKSKYKNKPKCTLDLEWPLWISRSQIEATGVGHHASSGLCYTGEKRKANIGSTQTKDLEGLIFSKPTLKEYRWRELSSAAVGGFFFCSHRPHPARIAGKTPTCQCHTLIQKFVGCGPWDPEDAELSFFIAHPKRKQNELSMFAPLTLLRRAEKWLIFTGPGSLRCRWYSEDCGTCFPAL